QYVWPELLRQRRNGLLEGRQICLIAGIGKERQVYRVPGSRPGPGLARVARAGEQVPSGLVQGYGQHLVAVIERVLDAIAMVRVDIDISNAGAPLHHPGDGDGRVVEDAEA